MTLLVLSDSHGRADRVRHLIETHTDAAALLFLGDGIRDLPADCPIPVRAVRGNCDIYTFFDGDPAPDERTEAFGQIRITLLHGHTRGAKWGCGRLAALGAETNADLVCFGHTHEPLEQYIPAGEILLGRPLPRPLYLFNPGSLNSGSFGLVTLTSSGILLSHGRL